MILCDSRFSGLAVVGNHVFMGEIQTCSGRVSLVWLIEVSDRADQGRNCSAEGSRDKDRQIFFHDLSYSGFDDLNDAVSFAVI